MSQAKINKVLEIEGYDDITELMEESLFDGRCPAICMNEECDYTEDMEPDVTDGWCPECETNSMKSPLILGGLI